MSVGEVNLLAPLLRLMERERPDWECVISTTTKTGMALAKKKYAGRTVFYCPLDFTWAVNAAMRRIRPDVLVLAELELWPNLVWAARRHGARTAVINGRLSQRSFEGYRRIRPLVARLLRSIDCIAVQDETYSERFRALGARPEAVHVTGSMKYDGAQTDRDNPATRRLAALAGLAANDMVFLAGSTQEPEESVALRCVSAIEPRLAATASDHRAPSSGTVRFRRPNAGRFRRSLAAAHVARSWSREREHGASPCPTTRRLHAPGAPPPRVLLVDVVGELGAWWGTAQIAFVGGSLGNRGGQNMIEPAAYGAAVSFGPNTRNFRDIVAALLDRDAAVVVADGEQLLAFVRNCLANPAEAAARGQRAASLVRQQLGATERTFQLLLPLVAGQQEAVDGDRRAA